VAAVAHAEQVRAQAQESEALMRTEAPKKPNPLALPLDTANGLLAIGC